jgi:hypothetical protein
MTYSKELIKEKLISNQTWLERGIIAIYKRQTKEEQWSKVTKDQNGIGFNGVDSSLLSSFAEQLIKGRRLTDKQLVYAKKKMIKYASQLAEIANSKILA